MESDVYRERAHLVAALSKLFPASLEADPAESDWPVCIIDLPTGQVSWHIALSDMALFAHLPKGERVWDGHTTEEKYARLDALEPRLAFPLDLALAGAKRFYEATEALTRFAQAKPDFNSEVRHD